ncbi:MAG: twin-arginine translocase TatA/TatE family subunit [Pseudochelatococcus sp.]|jgi:sec-independent protein translocase protein TatA|uniref:twin-arginine translocase TatA/TatE family subunit n=1 Tax=Pseudochelatococcus sp. TaxID=2020869 RepID=UPI003D947920
MGGFGSIWHWIIVGGLVLLLFGGRGKISDLMGDVAKGIKAFKKGLSDDDKPVDGAAAAQKPVTHQEAVKQGAPEENKVG